VAVYFGRPIARIHALREENGLLALEGARSHTCVEHRLAAPACTADYPRSLQHMGRNWSGEIAEKEGQALVRSGPYRHVRHRIYTAMIAMTVGAAMVSGELHALCAIVSMCAAYVRRIHLEETHLRAVFTRDYDEYRRATRALIPGLW
jgi:hypothetical protein